MAMRLDRSGLSGPSSARHLASRRTARRAAVRAAALCVLVASVAALAGCGPDPASGAGTTAPASATTAAAAQQAVVLYGVPIKPAVTLAGQATDGAALVSGAIRTYRLYVPASLARNKPVPLLVALHGGLGSGPQFEQQTGFDGLAEANGFIVVYPNGTPIRPGSGELVWNAGACCSVAAQEEENVNDVGFISALITKLEARYDIDTHRVFVTGHSNGAMLAERLACELAGQIAAIAVQAGTLVISQCRPAQPVAVLEIHGTADQNVPVNGGVGPDSLNKEDYPPPVDALRTLAAQDRCPAAPATRDDPANSAVTFEVWHPCRDGTVVEWAKVSGANHAWMGHPASRASELLEGGPPYLGFDSSAAVWSFLAAHPRP
jgi:polyhydroxybutyrate depolymerase